MLNLKKAAAIMAAVVIAGFSASAADVTVKMNGVGTSEYMSFNSGSPIVHNDTLFVPARALADSAGMNVSWDQTTQTAIFSVDVRYGADTPQARRHRPRKRQTAYVGEKGRCDLRHRLQRRALQHKRAA